MRARIFIVDIRESTARGAWKSPEQREKVLDQTWFSTLNQAMRGKKGMTMRRKQKRGSRERGPRGHMADMSGLYRNETLGEGQPMR